MLFRRLASEWHSHFRTGNPFTLRSDRCQASGNCFPDLVAGKDPKDAPEGGRRPEKWFDTSAVLRDPAPGTLGNLGLMSNNNPGQQFWIFRCSRLFGSPNVFALSFARKRST